MAKPGTDEEAGEGEAKTCRAFSVLVGLPVILAPALPSVLSICVGSQFSAACLGADPRTDRETFGRPFRRGRRPAPSAVRPAVSAVSEVFGLVLTSLSPRVLRRARRR